MHRGGEDRTGSDARARLEHARVVGVSVEELLAGRGRAGDRVRVGGVRALCAGRLERVHGERGPGRARFLLPRPRAGRREQGQGLSGAFDEGGCP